MELGHDPPGFRGERIEDFDSFSSHRQKTDVVLGISPRLALTDQIHRILRKKREFYGHRYSIHQHFFIRGMGRYGVAQFIEKGPRVS